MDLQATGWTTHIYPSPNPWAERVWAAACIRLAGSEGSALKLGFKGGHAVTTGLTNTGVSCCEAFDLKLRLLSKIHGNVMERN